ncbi:probable cytochrome P450 4e1 [Teleopsis dalmanni]|uniref:probable cytochrome P450 4e1 n=1 Tax=Teleopsis dalmanni TaxID=139649 RepID=UPI0018CD43AE|nr:probable cytochrome P450 4e1 [Teleopsis dalmanni]
MLFLLLLFTFCFLYCYWIYSRYQNVWKYMSKIPGPDALPLFGNVVELRFDPAETFKVIRKWINDYHFETFRIYAGLQHCVLLPNPKAIELVLSSTTLTYKEDFYNFFYPWLGRGLLTANGQYWAKHRKMITPSFHFQILQDFLHIINLTTDRFMDLLEKYTEKGDMFDFQQIVTRSTIDVICESAMGTRVNAIEGAVSPIVAAMNDICYVIHERIISLLKRFTPFFVLTPLYFKQKKALRILKSEISEIIKKRHAFLKEHNFFENINSDDLQRPKMAFLDNLLTAKIDGKSLTFQEIYEEVSTFMFEGHDTTASAITFAIFCLARHTQVQQKAFAEQYEMFGNDLTSSPTYQQLQEMKYLELVIKETLRLYPSVPIIARTIIESTEIDGYIVPDNTTIVIPIFALGVDEDNYEQPYTFQPERFDADKRMHAHPYDFVPFSAGPRNCIGQKFAMMELKVTISKILRHFEILPAVDDLSSGSHDFSNSHNPYDPQLAALVTLKSTNGVYIRLKKRDY